MIVGHTGEWQKIDNSSVLSGVGTGQTVALWQGASSVTDSETLGNAPITVSGTMSTFAGNIDVNSFVEIGEDGTYPTNYGAVGFGGRTNGYARIFGGLNNKNIYITSGTGGDIKFRVNGTSTNVLDIESNGNATFAGDVLPSVDSTYDIGSNSVRWDRIYADNLYGVVDQLTVNSNDTFTGTYSLLWHAGATVYSSSFMTINGTTDTLSVPNISTTGNATFAGDVNITNSKLQITAAAPEIIFSVPSGGLDSRIYNDGSGNFIIGHGTNSSTPTTAITIDSSRNTTFAGNITVGTNANIDNNLTVSGGNITLGGTGRIQGIDTVSATTDAANKAYVDAHGGGLGPFLPLSAGSSYPLTGTLYGTGATFGDTTVDVATVTIEGGQAGILDIWRNGTNASYQAIRFRDNTNANTEASIGWGSNQLRLNGTSTIVATTGGSERMRITSTGNVGIGTTSPSSAPYRLTIGDGDIYAQQAVAKITLGQFGSQGDAHFGASGLGSPTVGSQDYGFYSAHNAYRTSTGAWKHSRTSTIPAVRLLGSGGASSGNQGFSFDYSANVGTADITWTNLMQILPSGNVGIGTASPQVRLTLRRENNGSLFEFNRPASGVEALYGGIVANDPYFYSNNGVFTLGINNPDGGLGGEVSYITMRNGATRYTTFEAGNVGIGTTSPSEKLHVLGDQLIFGDLLLEGSANSFRTVSMNTVDGSDNQTLYLCGGQTASTSRGGLVQIAGNEAATTGGSVLLKAGNVSTGDIDFYTANTQRMIINNAGNVGIGTTTPLAKLRHTRNTRSVILSYR